MNKFEAVQQFRASLQAANVPQQQRGALVRAFNAALSTTPDPDAAHYVLDLTQKRDWLNTAGYTSIFGSLGIFAALVINHTTNATSADLGLFSLACVGVGFGAGKLATVVDMTAIMAQVGATVGDWLDDEPEPEPETDPLQTEGQRRFIRQDEQRRVFVSTYEFSDKQFEDIANMQPGTTLSRPALEALGWAKLTTYFRYRDSGDHRPGKDGKPMTVLAVIQEDLRRVHWIDNNDKITRYGINQARDQLRANSPTG